MKSKKKVNINLYKIFKEKTLITIFFFLFFFLIFNLLAYKIITEQENYGKILVLIINSLLVICLQGIGFSLFFIVIKEFFFLLKIVMEYYIFFFKASIKGLFLVYNQAFSSSFFVDFYIKKKNRL